MTAWMMGLLTDPRPQRSGQDASQSNRKTDKPEWLVAYQVRNHSANLDLFVMRCPGAGEHIMRTGLASNIADALRPRQDNTDVDVHDMLTKTLSAHFYGKFGQTNLLHDSSHKGQVRL